MNDNANKKELKTILEEKDILCEGNRLPLLNNDETLVELFKEIRKNGGLKSFGHDPVAWQREQRENRKLAFRDE